jgi:hypothetical protein
MTWRNNLIWETLQNLSETIINILDDQLKRTDDKTTLNQPGWSDFFWESDQIRRCHMQIIDKRQDQKIWLMHLNIFPQVTLDLPIIGFDVVAGQNKITGAFFDYSPVDENNPLMTHYKNQVRNLNWNKPRNLPEWAKPIFSDSMIAVGNMKEKEEIDQLCSVVINLLAHYTSNTYSCTKNNYADKQNLYCRQQKLNPHLHRSLESMGLNDNDREWYVNNILFPELC